MSQTNFSIMPNARDEQTALWQAIERRRLEEIELDNATLIAELAELRAQLRWLESCIPSAHDGDAVERPAARPFAIADRGRVMASASFSPANGFYPLESEGSGRQFRWTGPFRDFSINLALDRTMRWKGVLHALGAMQYDQIAGMSLHADAEMVPLQIESDEHGYHVAFTLPSRPADNGVRLTFTLPGVMRPCDLGQGMDERALGLRFHALDMECA